jgi:hypothetical protein
MSLFLLTYSRRSGAQPKIERFEDPRAAWDQFTAREQELRGSEQAVVLLIAEEEDTLRQTHSHYFTGAAELVAQVG